MFRKAILAALFLLAAQPFAFSAGATFYVDTGGCNTASTTQCSGTTDSSSATAFGAGSTITCNATSGPGATPGCIITGTGAAAGQLGSVAVDGSQALYVNCASNASNNKIFHINAVDNGTGAVGTVTTPTGCTASTSDWGIGGRYIGPSGSTVYSFQQVLTPADTVVFNNTPAAKTVPFIVSAVSGTSGAGYITMMGKAGSRPQLVISSGVGPVINQSNTNYWYYSNLELIHQGTTNACLNSTGAGTAVINVKISLCPANGILITSATNVYGSEITGAVSNGIGMTNTTSRVSSISGNYIHGNTGAGISSSAADPQLIIVNNIISGNSDRGIILSGSTAGANGFSTIYGNTVYGNLNSGLEVTDADTGVSVRNNIFQENGDAAGEYNVEWAAGAAELGSIHNYNSFYHSNCQGSGTGGPACVSGLTVNSTEISSDALFANAGTGDFSLASTSPARGVGYPGTYLGGSVSSLSLGGVQPSGSGGAPPFFGGF